MAFVQNFPFISILLSLFAGPISSVLNGKSAKRLNLLVITVIGGMSAAVLAFVLRTGQEYVYTMGHFPAPWGNEIRVGILEAAMALFFCIIMFLCVIGGALERELVLYYGESAVVFSARTDLYERFVHGLCFRGNQYYFRLRSDYDTADGKNLRGCRPLYDYESVGLRSAAARHLFFIQPDGASFDEQYQRAGGVFAGIGRISCSASRRYLSDVGGNRH